MSKWSFKTKISRPGRNSLRHEYGGKNILFLISFSCPHFLANRGTVRASHRDSAALMFGEPHLSSVSINLRAFSIHCFSPRRTIRFARSSAPTECLPSVLRTPRRSSVINLAFVNSTFTANTSGTVSCADAEFFSE